MARKPKKRPSPFENDEATAAFKQALRSAFAANRALLDFTESVLHDNPIMQPLDAIQRAAAAAHDAEMARSYFLRLSHKCFPGKVSLN